MYHEKGTVKKPPIVQNVVCTNMSMKTTPSYWIVPLQYMNQIKEAGGTPKMEQSEGKYDQNREFT